MRRQRMVHFTTHSQSTALRTGSEERARQGARSLTSRVLSRQGFAKKSFRGAAMVRSMIYTRNTGSVGLPVQVFVLERTPTWGQLLVDPPLARKLVPKKGTPRLRVPPARRFPSNVNVDINNSRSRAFRQSISTQEKNLMSTYV